MPELKLPEVTLHYELDGHGPPLVLIPGLMSDSASWHILVRDLARHFTLIRPDNRTTGRTRPWDAPASVRHYVDDLLALLEHLGCDRAHMVGHSLGGLIALETAALHPQRILTVTALTAPLVTDARMFAVFDALLALRRDSSDPATWLKALYPWIFRSGFFENPANAEAAIGAALAYPHAQSIEAMAHQLAALKTYALCYDPRTIAAPVQALFGGQDLLVGERANRAAFAAYADVRQRTIPNAAHSLHWDAPGPVAEAIIGFASQQTL